MKEIYEKNLKNKENVFYPIGGLANICNDILDLYSEEIQKYNKIEIIISCQLNSFPHIGTIVNFMCAFAIAKKIKKQYTKEVNIIFDCLENVSAETIEKNGHTYYISLRDKKVNGKSIAEANMVYFEDLLKRLNNISGIPFVIRTYDEYQSLPLVRKIVMQIIKEYDKLAKILNPSEKKIHIRTVCPVCKWGEKKVDLQSIVSTNNENYVIKSECYKHGKFEVGLNAYNKEFIDLNCQLRDLVKGAYLIEKQKENIYGIMIDGGDWGGLWPLRVFSAGLMALGYDTLPGRYFTPTITDWAGTKLSKRLYVGDHAFREFQEGIMNYEKFIEEFGDEGFKKLWKEINQWIDWPAKFFRDYSVDYLKIVLCSFSN